MEPQAIRSPTRVRPLRPARVVLAVPAAIYLELEPDRAAGRPPPGCCLQGRGEQGAGPVRVLGRHLQEQLDGHLHEINRERALIVVEHDMQFIRMIASKVTVFNQGSVLVEDSVENIMRNPQVRDIYLGKQAAA